LPSSACAQPAANAAGPGDDSSALRVVQLVAGEPVRRNHPDGLPSLLAEVSEVTRFAFSPDPVFIRSFDDPRLFSSPFTYVNFADRSDWNLSAAEVSALQDYFQRGGFLYIDAGINAEFLRDNIASGQSHSFADWQVTPVLEQQFERVMPQSEWQSLPRSHPIFRGFHSGLPDPQQLPEAIRDYIINEKWPQGSYSAMGLHSADGRMVAMATPIIAMGWGRDRFGRWSSRISFRVREAAEGMDSRLRDAAAAGPRFEIAREDGATDLVFTQPPNVPAWVREPDGSWRVFRYYHGEEISDYAHEFYTRLGVNIFVYVLTEN
jgi:hypothetical protein